MIKAVVADLDKYEKQAEGLTPADKRYINNILRFLPMTEARLSSSKNQSHQSWLDASERLSNLKSRLNDLKAGKTATATAAKPVETGAAAPTGMTDAQLSKKYQSDYKALSNELRGTHISKFVDEAVVSGFKAKFTSLKGVVDSFKDEKNKSQFMTNYAGLEKWFKQKVASANKQAAGHKAKADSRVAAEQARQKAQADAVAARALAEENEIKRIAAENAPDVVAHKEFTKAYRNVRVALQVLDPGELAKPEETKYWKKKLKEFAEITAKFSDREAPDAKKDLALYAEMKEKIEGGLAASEQLGIGHYPDYQKDVEILDALSEKYRVGNVFTKGKELKAKKLHAAYAADQKTYDTLLAKYKVLMDGNRAAYHAAYKEANTLRTKFRYSGERLTKFAGHRDQFFSGIVPEINGYLKEIEDMIASANEKNDPQFFTGGIQQKSDWTERSLFVYKTVAGEDNADYKAIRSKFDNLKIEIKKAETRLIEKIIVVRKTPDDQYKGADREKLLQMLVEDFKEFFPGEDIIATGIEDSQWERTTEWKAYGGGGLYKTDYSKMDAWLITKKDGRLATLYWTSVSKNHMKGNELLVFGYRDGYKGSDMLLSNVQP